MKRSLLLLVPLLVVVLLVIWRQPAKQVKEPAPEPIKVELLPREALLYFADPAGRYLVSEIQQIGGCDEDRDCVGNLIASLISGPQGELLPILPPQAEVLNVELRDDLVIVDFNGAFVHAHPGGSLSELLTVYGLVNSLAVNFPYLKQMQILVEGQPVGTLKGHLSLDRPVMADFSYSRQPQTDARKDVPNE
ncbi:MAG: GerMN domain-containing protein [Desulfuromonadales bacterium]|nr:GerMN domain-containing protein [Desulfuromonadales bacterium]